METTTPKQVDPSKIIQAGTGFFATKTLLTAVNMELCNCSPVHPNIGGYQQFS